MPSEKSDYTAFVSTINFILGAGVLGIPVAFVRAGLLTSVLLLMVITMLSAAAMVWEVEAISRAEWLLDRPDASEELDWERERILNSPAAEFERGVAIRPRYFITPGRLDMIAVCKVFLGDVGRFTYMWSQTFYTFVTMWFYTVVVGVALSDTFAIPGFEVEGEPSTTCNLDGGLGAAPSNCRSVYRIYAACYGVAMLLSMVNDSVIRRLQIALSLFADVCIVLMVGTALVALVGASFDDSESSTTSSDDDDVPLIIDTSGFGVAFSAFIFAQLAMHGVPVLIELMAQPRSAKFIFGGALGMTMVMYATLGIICGMFFGMGTAPVITLNWKSYTAETQYGTAFSTFVSYFVRSFPLVTISAAFPLNAVALGKALEIRIPLRVFDALGLNVPMRVWLCRMAVSIPSIIGAIFLTKVTTLLAFAGVLAYLLGFILPALLQLTSQKAIRKYWDRHVPSTKKSAYQSLAMQQHASYGALKRTYTNGKYEEVEPRSPAVDKFSHYNSSGKDDPSTTPYSWHFSHPWYAVFTLVFSAIAIPYSLVVAFS